MYLLKKLIRPSQSSLLLMQLLLLMMMMMACTAVMTQMRLLAQGMEQSWHQEQAAWCIIDYRFRLQCSNKAAIMIMRKLVWCPVPGALTLHIALLIAQCFGYLQQHTGVSDLSSGLHECSDCRHASFLFSMYTLQRASISIVNS